MNQESENNNFLFVRKCHNCKLIIYYDNYKKKNKCVLCGYVNVERNYNLCVIL